MLEREEKSAKVRGGRRGDRKNGEREKKNGDKNAHNYFGIVF